MQKQYKTKDIFEATAMLAKKAKLDSLEREGNYYLFVFDDYSECQKLSTQYWRNELSVMAKDYTDAFRTLKDRLFART